MEAMETILVLLTEKLFSYYMHQTYRFLFSSPSVEHTAIPQHFVESEAISSPAHETDLALFAQWFSHLCKQHEQFNNLTMQHCFHARIG